MKVKLNPIVEKQFQDRKQFLSFYLSQEYYGHYKGRLKANCKSNVSDALQWLLAGHSIKIKGIEVTEQLLNDMYKSFNYEYI